MVILFCRDSNESRQPNGFGTRLETSMSKRNYVAEIESRVAGIPCIIGVIEFSSHSGSYSYNAPSDLDYCGYTELEYDILDRRGRPAAWLERKLDSAARDGIRHLVCECLA
jgi:hypothetical protein